MEYWHVMNRGVDKRQIVLSDKDRLRFVKDLLVLNNVDRVENSSYLLSNETGSVRIRREGLVTIHAWCLMGNHYHFLISEKMPSGVSLFLKKFNAGYSKYFNKRYNRMGALFQGRTKRVLIENDRQFLYILPYIHLNPLDFMKGGVEWRRQCLADSTGALKWIANYRWSSYRNYTGETEFAKILEGSELLADQAMYVSETERFLKAMPEHANTKLNLE